ncbi:hypothetical protein OIU84_018800 [Salix udensis]|uniref:Uncharacterized protein n=1 Tax=Salix udensis TaxID=889485 RepID=A0AAD6KYS1_9ROSI|nr:hypothetical protein OIU84_018800 [Salix udensis]
MACVISIYSGRVASEKVLAYNLLDQNSKTLETCDECRNGAIGEKNPARYEIIILSANEYKSGDSHADTSCMRLKCDDNKRDVQLNRENAALTSDVTNARINGDGTGMGATHLRVATSSDNTGGPKKSWRKAAAMRKATTKGSSRH